MSIDASRVLYFAYGSNMLSARLAARIGAMETLGRCELRAHELRFHKRGADGSGKCDVVPSRHPHALVQGALFELRESQLEHLHEFEGAGYVSLQVQLTLDGLPVMARTYQALPQHTDASLQPFDWYLALVIAGAEEHGLPADYLATLQRVSSLSDPDTARAGHHFALIEAVQARANAAPAGPRNFR